MVNIAKTIKASSENSNNRLFFRNNDVSLGHAEEAIYHLEKLIDYVTLISKNSYTTSVYNNESDMQ